MHNYEVFIVASALVLLVVLIVVLGPAYTALIVAVFSVMYQMMPDWQHLGRGYMPDDDHPGSQPDGAQAGGPDPPCPALDNSAGVRALFARSTAETRVSGDDRLMDKMKAVAGKAKEAILARTRFTSDNFRQYFDEELYEEENRHWWENDPMSLGQ